jgi:hypothetical protein
LFERIADGQQTSTGIVIDLAAETIKEKTNKLEAFHATIKPKDGRLFTVFEIVNYMLVETSTPIFGESTNQFV